MLLSEDIPRPDQVLPRPLTPEYDARLQAELRRRNLIRGEFPYTTTAGSTYDSGDYVRALDLDGVVGQLSASRDALRAMTELSDSQLDAIPPKDSFRFCDGQRTLEQVIASLLKHQGHQLDAVKAASR